MKNQVFSYHNHTYRCGHAIGADEQYIKSAIDSGIKFLGISDHIPFKNYHMRSDRMDYEQLDEYFKSLNTLKEKYKDKIDIKIGFEVEYLPEKHEEIKELREKCDYFLIGQHNMDMKDGQASEFTFYCDDDDVILYSRLVCEAMETGMFSILNHPDYFMLGRRNWSEACDEATSLICACAKRCKIPLEVNLKGVRRKPMVYEDITAHAYPYREFWEIVEAFGNDVVYGHDAHAPIDFMDAADKAKVDKILEGLSLNFIDFRI